MTQPFNNNVISTFAKNSSEAARMAGISRSAFYKYKDGVSVYGDDRRNKIVTYYLTLMDNPARQKKTSMSFSIS